MLRHVIAPARFFTQTPNDLIRHPRLSGTAVRLLQWALSLPPGSRETLTSIGEKMPEGRDAFRKARRQLEAEGYVHTRRRQHPETGYWQTRVLVSNVPLREPQEVDAAFAATDRAQPADRADPAARLAPVAAAAPAAPKGGNPTAGEPEDRALGGSTLQHSPKWENIPNPDDPDDRHLGRAARLLHRLAEHEAQLRLGTAEAAALAPLAARWLTGGVSETRLRAALTEGLPPVGVKAPAAFLAHRLTAGLPAPARGAAQPLAECARCGDPLARGQSGGVCAACAGLAAPPRETSPQGRLAGAARVRAALRGTAFA